MNEKISPYRSYQFQRSRNVGRNLIFGLLNHCVSLLLPFIVRTVLIYHFGVLYLGMNSLLASIFQVLNLAELGFGTAVVYRKSAALSNVTLKYFLTYNILYTTQQTCVILPRC